ncbi:MAG TPA: F0F1 ATP synthase subunit A [Myxococcota bacterium]|nr:F0F1 ATP synthase subunit A [Myxococcota bacterium]
MVEHAAQAATSIGEQVKEVILHHINNGWEWGLPSTHWETPVQLNPDLWRFTALGIDVNLSISKHVLMMLIAAGLLILMGILVRRKLSLIPKGFASVVESFVLFIRDELAVPTMGQPASKIYTPFLCTTFFFILTMNLMGLLPYGATPTGNISVTAGLATMAFLAIQFAGMRKMGVFGYFGHLVPHGVPWWLAPVMIVVELMGIFAKPFALCVRLFANMIAGHVVILSLIGLIFVIGIYVFPVVLGFALFMYILEIFVSFLQAYIFTILTSLFIGLFVAGEH